MIDFNEARARREQIKYSCMGCGRELTKETAKTVTDDAEVFIVCATCKPKFETRKRQKCPKCGRKVIHLYPDPTETRQMCAICLQQEAEEFDPDGPDGVDLPDDIDLNAPPTPEELKGPFPPF